MKKLGYNLPLQPTRHEVFFLKKGPGAPTTHPVVFDLIGMTYMREESPDLMLAGDIQKDEHVNDPDGFDQGTTMEQTRTIWGRLGELMPSLTDAELFTSFSGLYTNTPDNHPIIGKVDGIEGLYIAAGFNGFGFKISPAVGVAMAELITGERRRWWISARWGWEGLLGWRRRLGGPCEWRSGGIRVILSLCVSYPLSLLVNESNTV